MGSRRECREHKEQETMEEVIQESFAELKDVSTSTERLTNMQHNEQRHSQQVLLQGFRKPGIKKRP